MTIGSQHLPASTDRTDATRGLLIAALLLAAPQLAFAGFIAGSAWVETWGMTAQERADAWTEVAYIIAGLIAIAPVCSCLLQVPPGGSAPPQPASASRSVRSSSPAARRSSSPATSSRGGDYGRRMDRRTAYFWLMGTCLTLIVLAWFVVRFFSTPVAVGMSVVAAVIPPVAAIVANWREDH